MLRIMRNLSKKWIRVLGRKTIKFPRFDNTYKSCDEQAECINGALEKIGIKIVKTKTEFDLDGLFSTTGYFYCKYTVDISNMKKFE